MVGDLGSLAALRTVWGCYWLPRFETVGWLTTAFESFDGWKNITYLLLFQQMALPALTRTCILEEDQHDHQARVFSLRDDHGLKKGLREPKSRLSISAISMLALADPLGRLLIRQLSPNRHHDFRQILDPWISNLNLC